MNDFGVDTEQIRYLTDAVCGEGSFDAWLTEYKAKYKNHIVCLLQDEQLGSDHYKPLMRDGWSVDAGIWHDRALKNAVTTIIADES